MKTRRKFTKEFKQTAVRRLESGQSVGEVARALEVHPSDLQRWRRELREHGERAFNGAGKKRAEESRVHHILVVGQKEQQADAVSVRIHGKGQQGVKPRAEVIREILSAIRERQG